MENKLVKCFRTVAAETSAQGKVKGKHEYSSMTVSMYLLWEFEGNGPLKSTLSLSKG